MAVCDGAVKAVRYVGGTTGGSRKGGRGGARPWQGYLRYGAVIGRGSSPILSRPTAALSLASAANMSACTPLSSSATISRALGSPVVGVGEARAAGADAGGTG